MGRTWYSEWKRLVRVSNGDHSILGQWSGMVPVLLILLYFLVTVSLGKMPGEEALKGTPLFSKGKEADATEIREPMSTRVAPQTNTLMSLINAHESLNVASKGSRIWLGERLGSIPKRVHERMLHWEFMDMADFRPRS